MTFSQSLVGAALVWAASAVPQVAAQVEPTTSLSELRAITQTAQTQAAITPAQALALLVSGNERFLADAPLERDYRSQVQATAAGQYPFAFVLSCVDSRIPVETVFDQGIGDLFVGRVAGNFVNTDLLGSMEFATAGAGARLIVVMGHTECGAVKGACDNVRLGNLTHTLSNIVPAVYAVGDVEGERTSANKEFVRAVAHENVEQTVQNVIDRSPVVVDLIRQGRVAVIGAMLDIATGRVTFLDHTYVTADKLPAQ